MCDSIYIGNNQNTFKIRTDGHFYDLQRLLKNRQKADSFDAHSVQHCNTTMSHNDLRKYMKSIVVKQLKPIGTMKNLQNQTVIYVCINV